MKALITLKGLRQNEDVYIESKHLIEGDDIDQSINEFIYEFRNKYSYYKIKYMEKQIYN